MTAKQYLSQAYRLNERINSDLSELDRLRDLAISLSSVNYDGIRVSSTRSTEAPFEKTICKIIDAEKKINAEIERLVDLKAEISGAISQLANVDEQLLLRFRYINNYGWEKIAVLMSVSMRTVPHPRLGPARFSAASVKLAHFGTEWHIDKWYYGSVKNRGKSSWEKSCGGLFCKRKSRCMRPFLFTVTYPQMRLFLRSTAFGHIPESAAPALS